MRTAAIIAGVIFLVLWRDRVFLALLVLFMPRAIMRRAFFKLLEEQNKKQRRKEAARG